MDETVLVFKNAESIDETNKTQLIIDDYRIENEHQVSNYPIKLLDEKFEGTTTLDQDTIFWTANNGYIQNGIEGQSLFVENTSAVTDRNKTSALLEGVSRIKVEFEQITTHPWQWVKVFNGEHGQVANLAFNQLGSIINSDNTYGLENATFELVNNLMKVSFEVNVPSNGLYMEWNNDAGKTIKIDNFKIYDISATPSASVTESTFNVIKKTDIVIDVSLRGYSLAQVFVNETDITSNVSYADDKLTIAGSALDGQVQYQEQSELNIIIAGGSTQVQILGVDSRPEIIGAVGEFEITNPNDISITLNMQGESLVSVANGSAVLVQNTDYTFVNDVLIIKKEYIQAIAVKNTPISITITSEGGASEVSISVNKKPIIENSTVTYDLSDAQNLAVEIIAENENLTSVKIDNEDKILSLFNFSEGLFTINFADMQTLALNQIKKYNFILGFDSGSVSFVLNVVKNTPEITKNPIFDIANPSSIKAEVSLFGQEITEIIFNGNVLGSSLYSVNAASNIITFDESLFTNLTSNAVISVKTTKVLEFEVSVINTKPVIDTANNIIYDNTKDLTISLNTFGKEIVSVKIGDLIFSSNQYKFANNSLTIFQKDLADYLAVGSHELEVITESGRATTSFTVANGAGQAYDNNNISAIKIILIASIVLIAVGAVCIVLSFVLKRKKD